MRKVRWTVQDKALLSLPKAVKAMCWLFKARLRREPMFLRRLRL